MTPDPHAISLDDAIALTTRWRGNMPSGGIKAARFDRVAFDTILGQNNCAGIRIYLGMKGDGSWTYVVVGVDANANDLINRSASAATANPGDPEGYIEEEPPPCPPDCDATSPLNGNPLIP